MKWDYRDRPASHPAIVLFYPMLDELESTIRTTIGAIGRLDYPADRFEVVAVPNHDDPGTIVSLRWMQADFPFLQVVETPPTSDPSWRAVWTRWAANPKAYWWHQESRAGDSNLSPKETGQLIRTLYTLAERRAGGENFLVNYLDADSAPPDDHFLAAAHGAQRYDVLQSTNIAGNLNASMVASLHALDHRGRDGSKYRHMSANGRHPYWMLGKDLFFRSSDLVDLGGSNPWITIKDPEVGLRFWKNGRRLGFISTPLIEEVPETFGHGIGQCKRWVTGFWQSLGASLKAMDFTLSQRLRAWLNFLLCPSLSAYLSGPYNVSNYVTVRLGVSGTLAGRNPPRECGLLGGLWYLF